MSSEVKIEIEPLSKPEEVPPSQETEKEAPNPEEEALLTPQEKSDPPNPDPDATAEISAALSRTRHFAQKWKSISTTKPPHSSPFSYLGAVCGLCLAGGGVLTGILCCLGGFLLLEVIPICAIVMGAVYWDQDRYCPAASLPLLLVIGGVLKVLHLTLTSAAGRGQSNAGKVVDKIKAKKDLIVDEEANKDGDKAVENVPESEETKSLPEPTPTAPEADSAWFRVFHSLLSIAELTWFIIATVLIYGMAETVSYTQGSEDYCHPSLFRFAFFYITFFYVVLGLVILIPICICCCGLCALAVAE